MRELTLTTKQSGFTLLEVLLAGFILFLTIMAMTLVYRGALLSSAKAEQSLSVVASVPSIRAIISEKFHRSVSEGIYFGSGVFGSVNFSWVATLRLEAEPNRIFADDSGLDVEFRYSLWDVELTLTKGNLTRRYSFSEVSS